MAAHALWEARDAKSQVNAADRAQMTFAKHGARFGAVLARRPSVDAISGRAIGNASHHAVPIVKVFRDLATFGRAAKKAYSPQLTARTRRSPASQGRLQNIPNCMLPGCEPLAVSCELKDIAEHSQIQISLVSAVGC